MGNPYLTDDFPAIQNYICTFSNVTVSEISAARALFGEIPMTGQMPVDLSQCPRPDRERLATGTSRKLEASMTVMRWESRSCTEEALPLMKPGKRCLIFA